MTTTEIILRFDPVAATTTTGLLSEFTITDIIIGLVAMLNAILICIALGRRLHSQATVTEVAKLFQAVDNFDGLAEECVDYSEDCDPIVCLDQIESEFNQANTLVTVTIAKYIALVAMAGVLINVTSHFFGDVSVWVWALGCISYVTYRNNCRTLAAVVNNEVLAERDDTIQARPDDSSTVVEDDVGSVLKRQVEKVEQVRKHRRVHSPLPFVAAIIAEIKCQMGLPKRTEANMLVVRRMANNLCIERRVRPTHAKEIISLVVALVFIPDASDVAAELVSSSPEALKRHRQYKVAGGGGGIKQTLLDIILYPISWIWKVGRGASCHQGL
jgi:hypothetical protein